MRRTIERNFVTCEIKINGEQISDNLKTDVVKYLEALSKISEYEKVADETFKEIQAKFYKEKGIRIFM